jgi:methylenetetrahydrofolate reductase (NADPH)
MFIDKLNREFVVNVEVVPPASGSCDDLLTRIAGALSSLTIDAIDLADSPMACPRMSPVLFAGSVRDATGGRLDVIPHITVRDRNRVALQGLLWGAVATGIHIVLVVSGDPVQYSNDPATRHVGDLSAPELVKLARSVGLFVGVVMDARQNLRERELRKLEKKVEAGANFIITQPLYVPNMLEGLASDVAIFGLPVLLGILPLVSLRHARFLDGRVPGISIPLALIKQMESAGDGALAVGLSNAKDMLAGARQLFAGVCIMPPFNRFGLVGDLLG